MSDRPAIPPVMMADLTEAAPKRLVRKLDKNPSLAEDWAWDVGSDRVRVTTANGQVVGLQVADGVVAAVECSCLLAPRCLHVLAVASLLDVAEGSAPVEDADEPEAAVEVEEAVVVSDGQRRSLERVWSVACRVLDAGALGADTVLRGDLLRAVHGCRTEGCHRVAAAGRRVARQLQDLRSERPEFSIGGLSSDLLEMLATTHRLLGSEEASVVDLGVARRRYRTLGSLRVHGLFTEPVVTRSGYAGVVTWSVDDQGRCWSRQDLRPGAVDRVVGAYASGVGVGDVVLSHQGLCRAGMLLHGATGSADGRLGAGQGVRAVASGPSSWADAPLAALWEPELEDQLDRVFGALKVPSSHRRGGWNLLFLRARVLGVAGPALWLAEASGRRLRAVPGSDRAELPWRDNLRVLGAASGASVQVVARVHPSEPGTVTLLALASEDLAMPAVFEGLCNMGIDRLTRSAVPAKPSESAPVTLAPRPRDPIYPTRRRVQRVAMGGRATLTVGAAEEGLREAAGLERRFMPVGGAVLRALFDAGLAAGRSATGERRDGDPDQLARAWLAAAVWARAAERQLARETWLQAPAG